MKNNEDILGEVQSVDTGNVVIKVSNEEKLINTQVNHIIKIQSTKTSESIIGLVTKIMRKSSSEEESDGIIDSDDPEKITLEDIVKVSLIGTFLSNYGTRKNVFRRTLETIPCVSAKCYLLESEELSVFMQSISSSEENRGRSLSLGKYTISEEADAYLDGNKFFQRHAVIVGSTGSGKSWTVAEILAQSSQLQSVNSLIFDIHGEYEPLKELKNTTLLKIAGPMDNNDNEEIIYLPYWLLNYEEIGAMLLDRSDHNAPNQARILFDLIIKYKEKTLHELKKNEVLNNFTIDSPVPYNINEVLEEIEFKNTKEKVQGSRGEKNGPYHDTLTRFIQRLISKQSDKRLNFLFNEQQSLKKYDWFVKLIKKLMDFGNNKGIKIIDFSEVPSDILPLIAGLVARLIFSIQQWTNENKRHPIALFCDEAHLYIPADVDSSVERRGLYNFERIAKEGRKYGVSLVVISQRPADVSKTVLSQCGNFISMRLSNPEDQNVIRRLFPDNLGNFSELLPILDIGECLVVGDACLLPSRVKVNEPEKKPSSATIDFWYEWEKEKEEENKGLIEACESLRRQSKVSTDKASEDDVMEIGQKEKEQTSTSPHPKK